MTEPQPGWEIPAPVPLGEDRFGGPTDLCPHREYWTSTDGDSTEREVAEMVYGLVRGLQPDLCLETGTGFGEVAEQIGNALYDNNHGRLVTIEVDPERVAYTTRRIAWMLHPKHVTVVEGDSLAWEPDGVIEFAWFDSWYELRVPEFEHYRPFMRRGTIVCFHDTAPGHGEDHFEQTVGSPPNDIRTVLAEKLHGKIRMIHLPTPRGVTIGEVL